MGRTRKADGKKIIMNPSSLRNLKQFNKMPDTEFVEAVSELNFGTAQDIELAAMIEKEYKKYEQSYDLSDMMPNDIATLRALILANVRLTNYEKTLNKIEAQGISDTNILLTEKISKVCNDLRSQMTTLQDTLKISRKVRRSEKEQSVMAFLEDLKVKARTFYSSKMIYILCPKDRNVLATIWLQYPSSKQNVIKLFCSHCKDVHSFDIPSIVNNSKSSNIPEAIPESLR